MQRLGRHDLQCLLRGTTAEQHLRGLLTAARGGLSGADLEELTGAPLWEIEHALHTVAGRTFTRRVGQWVEGTGPEVYLMGHEELHTALSVMTGLTFLNRLTQIAPPSTRFVFLGAGIRLGLPSPRLMTTQLPPARS